MYLLLFYIRMPTNVSVETPYATGKKCPIGHVACLVEDIKSKLVVEGGEFAFIRPAVKTVHFLYTLIA